MSRRVEKNHNFKIGDVVRYREDWSGPPSHWSGYGSYGMGLVVELRDLHTYGPEILGDSPMVLFSNGVKTLVNGVALTKVC